MVRAWFQEGQETFKKAVSALRGSSGTLDLEDHEYSQTICMLIVRLGIFHGQLARYDQAEALLLEGLPILRALGNPGEIAFTLDGLGQVYRMTARYDLAQKGRPIHPR